MSSTSPVDKVVELLRELRLPHMRRTAADLLATAKAQRWDPAEAMRALLTEELAGRQASSIRARRKAAGFPTGKTFDAWDENCQLDPGADPGRCAPSSGSTATRTSSRADHQAPARRTSVKRSARSPSMPATKSPGSVASTSERSCAATA